jgi:hypothetical protein
MMRRTSAMRIQRWLVMYSLVGTVNAVNQFGSSPEQMSTDKK